MNVRSRIRELDVKPTLIDRAISHLDPVRGLRRLHARVNLAMVGGYLGGRRDRRQTSQWRTTGGSADADILPDLPTLRERSRDLQRNTPLATGAVNTVVSNVVGTGLTLQARIDREALGMTDKEASDWQKLVEREFRLWAESPDYCDVTRTQSFYGLQGLIFRSALESGDCFTLLPMKHISGHPYETRIKVIEADRVTNKDNQPDSNQLAGGVELDSDGAPIAYHIMRQHPGALRPVAAEWDVVAAFGSGSGRRIVLHHFDRRRPGQTRGVPYLAPVIEPLKQIDKYTEAEIMAAVISGMFTVFVKSAGGSELGAVMPEETGATSSDKDVKLASGAIIDLGPGEEIQTADPKRPNANFDPFVQAILRQIGVALELPFEVLIKHFTASYSAARAALLEAWRFFRGRREWLAETFCQPVYEAWLAEAVASGRIYAPGFFADPLIRAAYCSAKWVGDSPGQIDPVKEVEAAKERINNFLSTRAEETTSLTGGDFETNFPQIVKEHQMLRSAGLEVGGKTSAQQPAAPDGENPDQFELPEMNQ